MGVETESSVLIFEFKGLWVDSLFNRDIYELRDIEELLDLDI